MTEMAYKYQGLGAGPTTRRMWVGIIATVSIAVVLYILMAIVLLTVVGAAHAATFKCRGFSFIYTELECEQPLPPATAGATFCRAARPISWSANDTRATKEAVDAHNRVWKKLCKKGA